MRRRDGAPRRRAVAAVSALGLCLAVAILGCSDARAGGFRARVIRVRDGDSVDVRRGDETIRIRLQGIDCPERGQPWSAQAKQATARLAGNREVVVRVAEKDTYGRSVARITLPDGKDLGEELVAAGLAWHYKHFSHDATLAHLEEEARAAKRGLWADPHPVPPWDYRRRRD